jgi:hypothetical protein
MLMPVIRFAASLALAALLAAPAFAQAPPRDLQPAPAPPPLPESVQSGQPLEPEVTIVPKKEGATVQEYRVNGRVYAIKVVPDVGPPYYLIDVNGDGRFEMRRSDLASPILIPAWVIFRW